MTNLRSGRKIYKKPIWLSALAYYSICIPACLTLFLFLHFFSGSENDKPILASAAFLTFCILLREVFLRSLRNRFMRIQKQLDENLRVSANYDAKKPQKLTIEQNTAFLKDIERKSQAAKIFDKIPEAHFKVFQACDDYLKMTEKELEKISVNSPRLGLILRGRRYVMKLHKEHLLTWAELESKNLIQSSKNKRPREIVQKAQETIEKLNFALSYYPKEEKLIESITFIRDIIASAKASDFIRKAEKAISRNQIESAIEYYSEALLNLENSNSLDKKLLTESIKQEIEKLKTLVGLGERKQED